MAEFHSSDVELDFYLTERAMGAAKAAGVIALDYDTTELQALLDYVHDESGKTLPAPLGQTSFVIMYGAFNPSETEPHYHQAPLDYSLIPSTQLAVATTEEVATITKQELVESGRRIHEVRPSPKHFYGGIGHDIARVVLGPRPEDAQIVAPVSAWASQVHDAFFLTGRKKQRIQDEVAHRFPNAVRLRRATDPQPAE